MDNVETIVIAWLNSLADASTYPASGDVPDPRPASFITVDRTGGPREAMVLDKAEILIEVYHKTSRLAASNKANAIGDVIIALEAYSDNITHADINSVVNLPDLIGQYHRYQVYCDVWFRR